MAPADTIDPIVNGAVPVFFNTDDCDALDEPTSCDPKPRLAGVNDTAGPGTTPVPLNPSACGEPAASSLTLTLALRPPAADGEKTRVIVHVAFAANVAGANGQSLDNAKSPAFAPTTPTLATVNGAAPVFFNTDDCDALDEPTSCEPNAKVAGVKDTAGAAPVPVRPTLCGLPAASSPMLTLALRAPAADGLKVTATEQVAPAASVAGASGQVLVAVKSAAFAPTTPTLLIVSGPVPVFFTTDDCDGLVDPTGCDPKPKLGGVSDTAGAGGGGVPPPDPL